MARTYPQTVRVLRLPSLTTAGAASKSCRWLAQRLQWSMSTVGTPSGTCVGQRTARPCSWAQREASSSTSIWKGVPRFYGSSGFPAGLLYSASLPLTVAIWQCSAGRRKTTCGCLKASDSGSADPAFGSAAFRGGRNESPSPRTTVCATPAPYLAAGEGWLQSSIFSPFTRPKTRSLVTSTAWVASA